MLDLYDEQKFDLYTSKNKVLLEFCTFVAHILQLHKSENIEFMLH